MSEDKERERGEPEMPNDRYNFWLQIYDPTFCFLYSFSPQNFVLL